MSGRYAEPVLGAAMTLRRPKLSILPMNVLLVLLNDSENPQNVHWKLMTAMTARDWNIIDSADLRCDIPPYKSPRPGIIQNTKNAVSI